MICLMDVFFGGNRVWKNFIVCGRVGRGQLCIFPLWPVHKV